VWKTTAYNVRQVLLAATTGRQMIVPISGLSLLAVASLIY
jgi:hypothetical protein